MDIRVTCYAGYRGEQSPRSFEIGGATFQVVEVLDCWLAPDHRYFKVRADDASTYILRHDIESDRWQLTFYERARGPGIRVC